MTVASDWAPLEFYLPVMSRDPEAVYGDLLPLLRESDLNLVNVECVLGGAGAPIPKGGPCLRADARHAAALAPFHVATLANNHSMDCGPESLAETLAVVRAAGLQTVGAGMDGLEAARPLVVERGGLRIGIVNCGEGEACASLENGPGAHLFDLPAQERQIRALKSQNHADVVIVVFHGGREHAPMPPPYVVEALRRFVDAGADAVIGHHPHVPQGIEMHGGVPIAYSQGNFVFRPADELHYTSVGYLVHLDFDGKRLAAFSLTPYALRPEGLTRLAEAELDAFAEDLAEVSRLLADPVAVRQAWNAFGDVWGPEGMTQVLGRILAEFPNDPRRCAAILHNLFFAPSHREYHLNTLKRLADGSFGDSPEWARRLVRKWMLRRIGEAPEVIEYC